MAQAIAARKAREAAEKADKALWDGLPKTAPPVALGFAVVELVLQGALDDLSKQKQHDVKRDVAAAASCGVAQVTLEFRAGSVIVDVTLPGAAAAKLLAQIHSRRIRGLAGSLIEKATLVRTAAPAAPTSVPRPSPSLRTAVPVEDRAVLGEAKVSPRLESCVKEAEKVCGTRSLGSCASLTSPACRGVLSEVALMCVSDMQQHCSAHGAGPSGMAVSMRPGLPLLRCLKSHRATVSSLCRNSMDGNAGTSRAMWRCYQDLSTVCGKAEAATMFSHAVDAQTALLRCVDVKKIEILPQCRKMPAVMSTCAADRARFCGAHSEPHALIRCAWEQRQHFSLTCNQAYNSISSLTAASALSKDFGGVARVASAMIGASAPSIESLESE